MPSTSFSWWHFNFCQLVLIGKTILTESGYFSVSSWNLTFPFLYIQILNLLDIHFPKSNKLHKIFNRNTVKVSYCCTENLSSIIKTHNKKVTNEKITPKDQCNCKNKTTAHLMITAKQMILYINALPQSPLIQTKYAQEQLKETSKKDTIITRHHSRTEKRQMIPPSRNMYGK